MSRRTARCGGVIGNARRADRQAGLCYRAGDHGAALDFLQIARLLDPARAALWDQREAQVRAAMPARVTVAGHGSSEYGSFHREAPSRTAPRRHGRYYPPGLALPEGICPACRSVALTAGRHKCQACGLVKALAPGPHRAAVYAGLSHGQPGHMCVLPGAVQAEREAGAGS
jgi:hypothetical protein